MIAVVLLAAPIGLPYAAQDPALLATPEAAYRRPQNRVRGDRAIKIVFLRTSFENDMYPAVSRHSEESLKEVGESLTAYFNIQSYGLMNVEKYEISPVVKLRESSLYERFDAAGNETDAKKRRPAPADAIAAAKAQLGRDLTNEFDFVCVLVNSSPTAGKIAPQGVAALATGAQTSIFFGAKPAWRVFAHEIGHNFGFSHAWSLEGKVPGETLPAERTFIEYGDKASPMGKGNNSYSVVERYRMGWIGASETDTRFIKRFEPGDLSFGAYDLQTAKGCVGGYLEGEFGVDLKELVSRRDKADRPEPKAPVAAQGPQRLWLSVVSRGNFQNGRMGNLAKPVLLAHLSSLPGASKGAARAFTTVSLDLNPAKNPRRADALAGAGITVGETATIRMKDGKNLVLVFRDYAADTNLATVSASIGG